MPTYEYKCDDCMMVKEAMRRIADRHDAPRCSCGGTTSLAVSLTAVHAESPSVPYWMGPRRLDGRGSVIKDDTTVRAARAHQEQLHSYNGVDAKRVDAEIAGMRKDYESLLHNPERRKQILAEAGRKQQYVR